jgi:transposase
VDTLTTRLKNNRLFVEAVLYRYRTGIPWRDVPEKPFGHWRNIHKRHNEMGEARDLEKDFLPGRIGSKSRLPRTIAFLWKQFCVGIGQVFPGAMCQKSPLGTCVISIKDT